MRPRDLPILIALCVLGCDGADLPPVVGPLIMREFSVLGSLNQSVLPAVSLKITSASA